MDEKTIALASGLMRDRETAIAEVCETFGVSRSTLYRYVKSGRSWPTDRAADLTSSMKP